MTILKKSIKYFMAKTSNSLMRIVPDKLYLKIVYRLRMGQKLNLKNPKTFNEKIQWLKLNDRKPIYAKMVDKYEVKKYVADIIGEEYIVPTYGVWDKFEDINFDELPDQFVLKCTHDSGGFVICQDKSKLDIEEARKKINNSLKHNYYYLWREWPYKNVKPRIIAEKYMENETGQPLKDYKFFCFNGLGKFMYISTDLNDHLEKQVFTDFFDMDFNRIKMKFKAPNSPEGVIIEKPKNFDKMKEFSEKLAANIPHVRIDWYEVKGKLYFGEITFFHNSGFFEIKPEKISDELSDLISTK